MHTSTSYLRMNEYIETSGATKLIDFSSLKSRLHETVNRLIVTDKTQWGSYMCKPSQFFTSRDSEYYAANKEMAEYECEYIVRTQLEDGSWDIPWGWDDFPDEWAISRTWWKGTVIVLNLLYLQGFGLI